MKIAATVVPAALFQLICLPLFSQSSGIESVPGVHPDWNMDRVMERYGYSATQNARDKYKTHSTALHYDPPVISNFMTKHQGEDNWDAWRNSLNNFADPSGTSSTNMGSLIREGKASVLMLSVPLVIGVKFTGESEFGIEPREAADVSRRYDKALNGDYDQHYRWLVDRLFDFGYRDRKVIMRLNHEMTNPQYTYCCMNTGGYDNESKHKLVWRHAVDVMRARADEHHGGWPSSWLFDFNPQSMANSHSEDWDTWVLSFYPGDKVDSKGRPYVDIASCDIYDRWGKENQLAFWECYRRFVNARDVMGGVCEWGPWSSLTGPSGPGQSGEDNPGFIDWFVQGLCALPPSKVSHIVIHSNFGENHPEQRERYLEVFGQQEAVQP